MSVKGIERKTGLTVPGLTVALVVLVMIGIVAFASGRIGAENVKEQAGWKAVLDAVSELGLAIMVAGGVLVIIEFLVINRIVDRTKEEVEEVLNSHLEAQHERVHEMLQTRLSGYALSETGMRNHFAERKDAMPDLLQAMRSAKQQIKSLGVCQSLFWTSGIYAPDQESFQDVIYDLLMRGVDVEFVYMDRRRTDLYKARDFAEHEGDGSALLKDTRVSLNCYALPLYFKFFDVSWEVVSGATGSHADAVEGLESCMRRFRIYETSLPASLSVLIADERMFVSPYLAKECSSAPCYEYSRLTNSRAIADDWEACREHYTKNVEHAKAVIPDSLVQSMCADPAKTRALREKALGDDPIDPGTLKGNKPGPYEEFIRELGERSNA